MEKTDNSVYSDLFNSKREFLKEYGNLFVEEEVDGEKYHMEIPTEKNPNPYRIVVVPSGIVGVSSFEPLKIWELDAQEEESKIMLVKLNSIVQENINSDDIRKLVKEFRSGNQTYFTRILPYSQQRSTDVLRCILDEKLKKLE